mmetsp:Transcript_450/g.1118  ORF Transcript_450/g.1118 Transcript_450/m.1118 type:complete len:241 (-) Transcript_450:696-1418(-)
MDLEAHVVLLLVEPSSYSLVVHQKGLREDDKYDDDADTGPHLIRVVDDQVPLGGPAHAVVRTITVAAVGRVRYVLDSLFGILHEQVVLEYPEKVRDDAQVPRASVLPPPERADVAGDRKDVRHQGVSDQEELSPVDLEHGQEGHNDLNPTAPRPVVQKLGLQPGRYPAVLQGILPHLLVGHPEDESVERLKVEHRGHDSPPDGTQIRDEGDRETVVDHRSAAVAPQDDAHGVDADVVVYG